MTVGSRPFPTNDMSRVSMHLIPPPLLTLWPACGLPRGGVIPSERSGQLSDSSPCHFGPGT